MMNLMAADAYRVSKGWTMRGILIGLFAATMFVALTFLWLHSGNLGEMTVRMEEGLSPEQIEQGIEEFNTARQALPHTGSDFAMEMLATNMLPFFLMSVFLVVFGEDLFCGAYRNALTYETDRKRVYMARLLTGTILTTLMSLFATVLYLLCGGVVFGFGAYSAENLSRILIVTLLLLPTQIAVVSFGQCLCAIFRRSGAVVAAYLIVLLLIGTLSQVLMLVTGWDWLVLLDWNSVGKLLRAYWTMPAAQVALAACLPLAAVAITSAAGCAFFVRADLTN